jgi:hypothetical protein
MIDYSNNVTKAVRRGVKNSRKQSLHLLRTQKHIHMCRAAKFTFFHLNSVLQFSMIVASLVQAN